MNLRVVESQWNSFVGALCARGDVETAGIILAERLKGDEVLLARQLLTIPEHGYLIRHCDQLRLDPLVLNQIIRPARDQGLSILTVHTHPRASRPWFSAADDSGDLRLMPSFFNQMPGPHGSMVVAGDTGLTIGRVWSGSGIKSELQPRIVGNTLRFVPTAAIINSNEPWFNRQRLALGKAGHEDLRHLHVAIIGLGGTGSVTFVQLAHLGVGRITVVDGDRVEASNVSRVLGATVADAGRTWKVDVAARYAENLGLGTDVCCLRGHLGKEVSVAEIEDCDVAVSCVDRHLPRALLNRLSYEKVLPLIDMGSAFRVDGEGRVVAGVGRVVIVGPGRPCLACWGHIDPNRIRIESLSDEDREREIADGYVDGAEIPQPSVVAFNTLVGGAAVVELLRMVTAFAGDDDPPIRLNFDFVSGMVCRNRVEPAHDCSICSRSSHRLPSAGDDAKVDVQMR